MPEDPVLQFKLKAVARLAMTENQKLGKSEAQNACEMLTEFYEMLKTMKSDKKDKAIAAAMWLSRMLGVIDLPETLEELEFSKWIEGIEKEEMRKLIEMQEEAKLA